MVEDFAPKNNVQQLTKTSGWQMGESETCEFMALGSVVGRYWYTLSSGNHRSAPKKAKFVLNLFPS